MAFAIMVSMLVSFTLTPMLSSRFLKLLGRRGRPQSEGARFLPLARRAVHAMVDWSLDHPGVIMAISVVTVLADVPVEPDGRPRVRSRTRTWASGSSTSMRPRARRSRAARDGVQAARRAAAASKASRTSSRPVGSRAWLASVADPYPLPLPGAADRRAEEHAGRDRSPKCGGVLRRIPATGRASRHGIALGGGEAGRVRDLGQHSRARPRADRRVLEAGARRGAEDARASPK